MTKFKVGDRVRQFGDEHWRGMTGVYDGIRTDGFGYDWEYFTPDADATFADGSNHSYAGELCGMKVGSFELVEEAPPIPAPIAERMRGLIERMVPAPQSRVDIDAAYKEARAIMAELVPVDADLIIARDDEARASEANGFHGYAAQTRKGEHDEGPVIHRYEGIKRGRELEREGR